MRGLYSIRQTEKPPMMGDLPLERVTSSKPFTHAGVDFASPFEPRKSKLANKSEKYIFAYSFASPRKQVTSKLSLRSQGLTLLLVYAVSSLVFGSLRAAELTSHQHRA